MQVLILNGPNLNLLGERDVSMYGQRTLADLEVSLNRRAEANGLTLHWAQSNHEGELIDALHDARRSVDAVILNPGGYGHTSVALRDAIEAIGTPTIEVHLTNLARREPFRHQTLTAGAAAGVISGFGVFGYHLALEALIHEQREAEES